MLIEKYRPQTFEEFMGMEKELEVIKKAISSPDGIPNLIFHGPPASGKTTLAHVIANTILGDSKDTNFFEFNASKDNGIDFIRGHITDITKRRTFNNAPYKIILMDEADYMTPDAQACCRRLMEISSAHTRFIFTANFPYKIIAALFSRCYKVEFAAQSLNNMKKFITKITAAENIKLTPEEIESIANRSGGDFRQAILLTSGDLKLSDAYMKLKQMSLKDIEKMSKNEKIELAFSGDANELLGMLWDKVKTEKAWQYLPKFSECSFKMSSSTHKTIFLASLLESIS